MANDYESYTKAIGAAIRPLADQQLHGSPENVKAWLGSVLTGRSAPGGNAGQPSLRRDDAFAVKLFHGLTQITQTVTSLEVIQKLARHSPARRAGVSRAAYLQLMVEAYLSEIYILKERCDRYRTAIIRAYRNDQRGPSISSRLNRVGELTADSFKSIVGTRSEHVHATRLEDNELGRARTLALLAEISGNKNFKLIENDALKTAKASKVAWMDENTKSVRRFLDLYFRAVSVVVLTNRSVIRYPTP
jgi:hypothetical protein